MPITNPTTKTNPKLIASIKKHLNDIQKGKINNSSNLLTLVSCLIIIIIICILISHYAFKNGTLTCNYYILSTYLYIILGILLICLVVIINDRTGFAMSLLSLFGYGRMISFLVIIVLLILMFVLIFLLHYINPQNIIAANTIWILLIFLTGLILIPIIFFARLFDVLGTGVLLTIIVVVITSLLGYFYGDKIIIFDWDKYLHWALMGLIIVSILGSFLITDYNTMLSFTYLVAIGGLIIFVLLLLSNHKKLKENAEKCIDGKVVPNYPVESYSIIIKIANILQDILRILMVRKLRR